ncbi:MAG: DUF5677 domain-containing protein [Methanotrichaceae archaeon]|jgi:hypothetical protein
MTEQIDFDAEIPKLRSYAFELAKLAVDILEHAKHQEYDHLIFMTCTFVCKQLSHIQSVVALVDVGQYKDALTISRVMAEGYAILSWANQEPSVHPLDWRAYVWIEQFKHLYGKPDYAKHKTEIEYMLNMYCRKFLKKAKNKPQADIVPTDYLPNWRADDNKKSEFVNITVKKIFEDSKLKDIHGVLYIPASGWVHWDSFSMAETIERKPDGGIKCGLDPKYLGAVALASGINALFGSASLLDGHLKLGFDGRLNDLYRNIEEGTKINAKSS